MFGIAAVNIISRSTLVGLSIELRLIRILYNSNLEDTLKEFKLFTLPGVKTRNIFMQNEKLVALRTTATYIVGTAKVTLFFLIVYRIVRGTRVLNDYTGLSWDLTQSV